MRYTETQLPPNTYVQVKYFRKPTFHVDCRWVTRAWLKNKDTNEVLAQAIAKCSLQDNPVRKIGRAIAVGRALKKYATARAPAAPDAADRDSKMVRENYVDVSCWSKWTGEVSER